VRARRRGSAAAGPAGGAARTSRRTGAVFVFHAASGRAVFDEAEVLAEGAEARVAEVVEVQAEEMAVEVVVVVAVA
jgi:hypothetical protein